MRVVFLGVGGGLPSHKRALPAVAVRFNGQILLFDCGEGTQIQLQRAKLSLQRITEIFISHLHGDHVLGLPGLLSSMALLHRVKPLTIYGPVGLKRFVDTSLELTQVQVEYDLTTCEINEGLVSHQPRYSVECLSAVHSVPTFSFILRMADSPGRFNPTKAQRLGIPKGPLWKKLQQGHPVQTPKGRTISPSAVLGPARKGVAIAYSGDTAPNPKLAEASKGVALLIHDATFTEGHAEKAAEYLHSTAAQAAEIAKRAEAKRLALIHISPRYENSHQHELEAQRIFPRSSVPADLTTVTLSNFIPV